MKNRVFWIIIVLYVLISLLTASHSFYLFSKGSSSIIELFGMVLELVIITPIFIIGARKGIAILKNTLNTVKVHPDVLLPGVTAGLLMACFTSGVLLFGLLVEVFDIEISFLSNTDFSMTPLGLIIIFLFFLVSVGSFFLVIFLIYFYKLFSLFITVYMVKEADQGLDPSFLRSFRKTVRRLTDVKRIYLLQMSINGVVYAATSFISLSKTMRRVVSLLIKPLIYWTITVSTWNESNVKQSFREAFSHYKDRFSESIFGTETFNVTKRFLNIIILVSIILVSTSLLGSYLYSYQKLLVMMVTDTDFDILQQEFERFESNFPKDEIRFRITVFTLFTLGMGFIYHMISELLSSVEIIYYVRMLQGFENVKKPKLSEQKQKLFRRICTSIENRMGEILGKI